jgi:hypothetical protein
MRWRAANVPGPVNSYFENELWSMTTARSRAALHSPASPSLFW